MTIRKTTIQFGRKGILRLVFVFIMAFLVVEISLFTAFSSARNGVRQLPTHEQLLASSNGQHTLVVASDEIDEILWQSEYEFEFRGISFHAQSKQKLEDGGLVIRCQAIACVKPNSNSDEQHSKSKPTSNHQLNVFHFVAPMLKGLSHLIAGFSRC